MPDGCYFLPDAFTVNVALAVLPAASAAVTVRRLGPFFSGTEMTFHDAAPKLVDLPVSHGLAPPALTLGTPLASAALVVGE